LREGKTGANFSLHLSVPAVPPSLFLCACCGGAVWGGEVNLRFYPNHPGLPRKPIPSIIISAALEPLSYAIKNANFPAFFKKLIT
jgi:hypothetical protein